MVVHYLSRVRGKYRWYDVVDFVIMGPLTVWFWVVSWWQNSYSIIAAISKVVNNFADQLDLKTFFISSYLVLLDETRAFLEDKGLLTEELKRIINYNITNSSNINVSQSQGVSIGKTVQSVAENVAKSVGG